MVKLKAAVPLVGALLLAGCSAFGAPYDWNNPSGRGPSKAQRKACNAACDDGDRSDRDDAMCHFACNSFGSPWYATHPEVRP